MKNNCCFIGHRKINTSAVLIDKLTNVISDLIVNNNVKEFLFGSKSEFDDLCYKIVTQLKEKHPYIKRVYARANYDEIDKKYQEHLLQYFEDSYCSEKVVNSGRLSYIKRNQDMIEKSDYCIFYYDSSYVPTVKKMSRHNINVFQPNSGTRVAFEYALKKRKTVYNVFDLINKEK